MNESKFELSLSTSLDIPTWIPNPNPEGDKLNNK
jgi:hypothetical protein